jgi:hypothetical protein
MIATVPSGDTSYLDNFGTDTYATRGIYDYVLVSVDGENLDTFDGGQGNAAE